MLFMFLNSRNTFLAQEVGPAIVRMSSTKYPFSVTYASPHLHTHTGSIYSDNALRAAGMNGECVRSGAVIAVKTHKSNPVSWTAEDKPSMAASNTDPKVSEVWINGTVTIMVTLHTLIVPQCP